MIGLIYMLVLVSVFTLTQVNCVKSRDAFWHTAINGVFRGRHFPMDKMVVENLAAGGQLALEHCQRQFKWERWNCPKQAFSRWNQGGSGPLTKEMAYLDAIISAAIVHVFTKNCSRGEFCQPKQPNKPKSQANSEVMWAPQYGDNVEYGELVAKKYLEGTVSGVDVQSFTNLHNIALGRKLVRNTMEKKCMCHGISGTCTLKTCWKQMASFSEVANHIRKQYDSAVRLDYEASADGVMVGNSASGSTLIYGDFPQAIDKGLVYLNYSPDYCKPNVTLGWQGTKGRTCTRAKEDGVAGKKSCKNLCRQCGHKVRRKKRKENKLCNCKFTWCCKVSCDTCKQTVREHYCA